MTAVTDKISANCSSRCPSCQLGASNKSIFGARNTNSMNSTITGDRSRNRPAARTSGRLMMYQSHLSRAGPPVDGTLSAFRSKQHRPHIKKKPRSPGVFSNLNRVSGAHAGFGFVAATTVGIRPGDRRTGQVRGNGHHARTHSGGTGDGQHVTGKRN